VIAVCAPARAADSTVEQFDLPRFSASDLVAGHGSSRGCEFCAFLRRFSGNREKDQVSIGSGWWQ
jgi:hypothetical protein